MKQVSSDKQMVAWWRLAECVSRGEKERALGIYRLLAHSIDDKALVAQLEADILFSFNDPQAAKKYLTAAELYKKDGRLTQAIALYESVLALAPSELTARGELVSLHLQHAASEQAAFHAQTAVEELMRQGDVAQALILVRDYAQLLKPETCGGLIVAAIENHAAASLIELCIEKVLDSMMCADRDEKKLQLFIAKLKAVDGQYAAYAQNYITQER
jgi:hypothetical protein